MKTGELDYSGHVVITANVLLCDHAKRSVNPYVPLDRLGMVLVKVQGPAGTLRIYVRPNE